MLNTHEQSTYFLRMTPNAGENNMAIVQVVCNDLVYVSSLMVSIFLATDCLDAPFVLFASMFAQVESQQYRIFVKESNMEGVSNQHSNKQGFV